VTRAAVALLVLVAVAACGPDEAPQVEVPSWAHVAPEQIAEAKKHSVPVAFENDLRMRFVLIPAGTFLMGSPEDEEGRNDDETQHEVTISSPFYMQVTEVTNGQFRRWRPAHHSGVHFNATDHPVTIVSHEEAQEFAAWLARQAGRRGYRLPTEAEWEYACRAGTRTPYNTGETISTDQAAFAYSTAVIVNRELDERSVVVASFPPNGWGLYDMHGSMAEWCLGPVFADDDKKKARPLYTQRGGSWKDDAEYVRSAYSPVLVAASDWKHPTWGFRLVSPLPEPGE
jgi:formylglycine-generating enzyme required for sulfatase activity